MSKVSFRARQIDFNKLLPILKNDADLLTEFSENTLINRGVPQIPSGMEKEEENEHHFVEVIQALQLHTNADLKIPVPNILDRTVFYEKLYPNTFILPKQLVHIRTVVLAEDEATEYDMDTDDEEWLSKSELGITPDKFESMIDGLERGCGQKVMNLEEAKCLLQDDPSLVIAVYDYWLNKRVQSRQPLLFSVRQERRDGGSNVDPYVAFRRRSEKMQTRKNRKNDEQSYEKMLILRDQMDSLGEILSRVFKREAVKEALVQCDYQIFETRCKLNDWDETLMLEAENLSRKNLHADGISNVRKSKEVTRKRSSRKRKLTPRALNLSLPTQSSEELSDAEQDLSIDAEPYAFVRTPGCQYLKPREMNAGGIIQITPRYKCPSLRYTLTTVPAVCHSDHHTYTGYIRRRRGRGGRIICDRLPAPPELSDFFENLDAHSRLNTTTSNCNSHTPVPRQSQAFDSALVQRLRPVVMSSQRGHPSFSWPICTGIPSCPSFEPLYPGPNFLVSETRSSKLKPFAVDTEKRFIPYQSSKRFPETSESTAHKPNAISTPNETVHTDQLCQFRDKCLEDSTRFSSKSSPRPATLSSSENSQTNVFSVYDKSVMPPSRRVWRKLTRPYGAVDALQSPEFPRSRGTETALGASNGIGTRMLHSSDDRLLLSDSSVLSPKLCCLTRDCVARESKVSGPQLQTTNGVSPQICQLPT